MRRFKQVLDGRGAGRFHPYLKIPIMPFPPTVLQTLAGYEEGEFNPLQLGVACIIVPPSQRRAPSNKRGTWNFNPVPNPAQPDHSSVHPPASLNT